MAFHVLFALNKEDTFLMVQRNDHHVKYLTHNFPVTCFPVLYRAKSVLTGLNKLCQKYSNLCSALFRHFMSSKLPLGQCLSKHSKTFLATSILFTSSRGTKRKCWNKQADIQQRRLIIRVEKTMAPEAF